MSESISQSWEFDANAMLTYGWVADRTLRVRWVNHSLANHLALSGFGDVVEEVNRDGVPITEFLTRIIEGYEPDGVAEDHECLGTVLERSLEDLANLVEQYPECDPADDEVHCRDCQISRVIRLAGDGSFALAGLLAVDPAGLRLRNDTRARVDLHTVCRLAREDGRWRVVGFQGHLQEAGVHAPPPVAEAPPADLRPGVTEFDGNAMLMWGWTAGCDLRVRWLNDAFRNRLDMLSLSDLTAKVDGEGVPISEFLQRILHPDNFPGAVADDKTFGAAFERRLVELTERIERHGDAELAEDEILFHDCRIRRLAEKRPGFRAGLRALKPDGLRLVGDIPRDRADLITVCQIVKQGHDWKVVGYQGQFQEAWLRIQAVVREGTKAGTVGLMGRNLSHNIGSHVLFGLEQDEIRKHAEARSESRTTDDDALYTNLEELARFHEYLRARMELLAAFATGVALPASSEWLSKMVRGFDEQGLVKANLGRSEGVGTIKISYPQHDKGPPGGEGDFRVAVPGGVVGIQGFFSLLENIARDGAKFGKREGALELTVRAKRTAAGENGPYLRVFVCDNQHTFESAKKPIRAILDKLKIVDEAGRLEMEGWGTKERLIAATYLRGLRLDNDIFDTSRQGFKPSDLFLSGAKPDGFKLLQIKRLGDSLCWCFYLPLAQDILLIDDAASPTTPRPDDATLTIGDRRSLEKALPRASGVRHRHVVLHPRNEDDLHWLAARASALPIGSFLAVDEGLVVPAPLRAFSTLDWPADRLYGVPERALHLAWLKGVVGPETGYDHALPMVIVQNGDFQGFRVYPDQSRVEITEGRSSVVMGAAKGLPVVFLDGHGGYARDYTDRIVRYEPHDNGKAARATADELVRLATPDRSFAANQNRLIDLCIEFVGAMLTNVLIVDERLDQRASDTRHAGAQMSYKDLCARKGVAIKGHEFSGAEISPEWLLNWVRSPESAWPEGCLGQPLGRGFDVLCLHRGITDKLEKDCDVKLRDLCDMLASHVRFLVLHSGRMDVADIPTNCRFLPLSNVNGWVMGQRDKLGIVWELRQLRRPSS